MPSLAAGMLATRAAKMTALTTTATSTLAASTTIAPVATATATDTTTSGGIVLNSEEIDMVVDGVSYSQRLRNARATIKLKVGEKVMMKQGRAANKKEIDGMVIGEHVPPQGFDKERTNIGIAGLDVDALTEDEDLAQVFLDLFCKDYRIKRGLMNVEVERKNKTMH
jgi:co-chaperonin GroES (HSP10)